MGESQENKQQLTHKQDCKDNKDGFCFHDCSKCEKCKQTLLKIENDEEIKCFQAWCSCYDNKPKQKSLLDYE